ncbi:MAG: hypothetical protein U0599_17045 [Vicinamibacteria bacterium]
MRRHVLATSSTAFPESSSRKPKETPKSPFPAGKFSGLMFGDYYIYDKWHQDAISGSNTNTVQKQQASVPADLLHLRPAAVRQAHDPFPASRRTATASSPAAT